MAAGGVLAALTFAAATSSHADTPAVEVGSGQARGVLACPGAYRPTVMQLNGLQALVCARALPRPTPTPTLRPRPTPRRTPPTSTRTEGPTTTAPTTTTTTTTMPPPAAAVPTRTTIAVPTGLRIATPGAFCTPEGALGVTVTGTVMRCTRTATDPRDRWRVL